MNDPLMQQYQLRLDLRSVDMRGGLQVLSAVAGIPYARMRQLMSGTGAPPTSVEISTINMLKGA